MNICIFKGELDLGGNVLESEILVLEVMSYFIWIKFWIWLFVYIFFISVCNGIFMYEDMFWVFLFFFLLVFWL